MLQKAGKKNHHQGFSIKKFVEKGKLHGHNLCIFIKKYIKNYDIIKIVNYNL